MRTQIGPNRTAQGKILPSPPIPDVSLCVVTHMTQHGYHKDRMEVVRLCIESMLHGVKKSGYTWELIIWDNESTIPAFVGMLQSFRPNVLVHSENIGGYNGRRQMLSIARGRFACITDDDILFAPDWLLRQMEILRTFPRSLANGCPRTCRGTYDVLRGVPGVRAWEGTFLPRKWQEDLAVSIGIPPAPAKCVMVERGKVRGWVGKIDMQLLGETAILRKLHLPYSPVIGTSEGLCDRIEKMKYIQVATYRRTALHIGNKIDKTITEAVEEMALAKVPDVNPGPKAMVIDNVPLPH